MGFDQPEVPTKISIDPPQNPMQNAVNVETLYLFTSL